MDDTNRGVIWAVLDGRPCGLVVRAGVVVEAWPPFLGKRFVDRNARPVWQQLVSDGCVPRWAPGVEPFQWARDSSARTVRRWERQGEIAARTDSIHLGVRSSDGRWWVATTGEAGVGWLFPTFDEASAEVAVRLATGDWERVPANYSADMLPLPDAPLSGEVSEGTP